jgi:tetratricopeptide (TPR) repeat protein
MKTGVKMAGLILLLLVSRAARADNPSFAHSLEQSDAAVKRGDLLSARAMYDSVLMAEAGNAADLCLLARRYCDLTYLTNSIAVQKELVARALACAQQALADDPTNAVAHASVAVCYAKSCGYADLKTELAYSRLFKQEAEKAIALDPKQDVAYYLLGRWNYALANVGFFSRAYVKIVYGGLPPASMQEAINNFKEACTLAPNRILNHAGLAMAYETAGDTKLEIAELKKCCALKPLGPEDIVAQADAGKKLAALQ